ncbi:lipoprotein [Erwinia sp. CPCC 100877]|nr:lipoprotein [Erwinia sp. CPCC 100877]
MKQLLLSLALVALSGCVQVDNYNEVVKYPAPAGMAGYWQSLEPQSEMVSQEAVASLVVTPEGDTLECRQWQRLIALPGKLMQHSDALYNVTIKREVYGIERHGDTLEYAGMTLHRVERLTDECADYLAKHPPGQPIDEQDAKAALEITKPAATRAGGTLGIGGGRNSATTTSNPDDENEPLSVGP